METPLNPSREKVNFMISTPILLELKKWVPAGERSDFANQAFEEAILKFRRKKAMEGMDNLRKSSKKSFSTSELLEARNHGRK